MSVSPSLSPSPPPLTPGIPLSLPIPSSAPSLLGAPPLPCALPPGSRGRPEEARGATAVADGGASGGGRHGRGDGEEEQAVDISKRNH